MVFVYFFPVKDGFFLNQYTSTGKMIPRLADYNKVNFRSFLTHVFNFSHRLYYCIIATATDFQFTLLSGLPGGHDN